jgi:hypothetical protein
MSQMMQILRLRPSVTHAECVATEDLVAAEIVYNKALGEGAMTGVVL